MLKIEILKQINEKNEIQKREEKKISKNIEKFEQTFEQMFKKKKRYKECIKSMEWNKKKIDKNFKKLNGKN